jgi:hypothetical protein
MGLTGLLLATDPGASAQDPGSTPGLMGELERVASTTPEEKVKYASDGLAEMSNDVRAVTKMLEAARKEPDSAKKVQCLANILTSMRALLAVSQKADVAMQKDLATGALELADHEFRKIAVALSRTRNLMFEAERCTASPESQSGRTDVTVEGDEGDEDDLIGEAIDIDVNLPDISPFT